MKNTLFTKAIAVDMAHFFSEDDLHRNHSYISALPVDTVKCSLKIKDDLTLAGLPYFVETFNFLGAELDYEAFSEFEGKTFSKQDNFVINFDLPFALALTGERIALNLLQRSSSIATFAKKFSDLATPKGIKILDTRKTTPGLRGLEKYATRLGGCFNHRMGQSDVWMVKDNHKSFFGGVKEAVDFFRNMNGFYTPIEVEIHDLAELQMAFDLGIKHLMLDNFSPEQIREAVKVKPAGVTYEASGGIKLETIESYLIEGLDAISIGSITYGAPSVDLSLKYERA
ncbi:nicotinate-nucleotide diphosphorylase (carboxylating) [Halobacteriovorax marinus]|uniref:nicotinate-nucleotide diphosphorylase (carboxylating) n=1 Tax=Halobacteriovorax marinus TaxID=97084 RepID=A0A1Y5F2W5_9BACT|nr:nicotinate-nucleotide diphosphorylase (carboxylating) [Halobacteriovorax marinus]